MLITILFFLVLTFSAAAQNTEADPGNAEKNALESSSDYGTSLFLRYNLTRPDYANTPYFFGFDLGTDIDFGGDIYFLNWCGISISAKYVLFNNRNEATDDISLSHYFSTGLSLYYKTRLDKPLNYGIRASAGSGWLIANEIDEYTENNRRLNGMFIEGGFFTEFMTSDWYYFESGVDIRKQNYYEQKKPSISTDMGFIYIKAGMKL